MAAMGLAEIYYEGGRMAGEAAGEAAGELRAKREAAIGFSRNHVSLEVIASSLSVTLEQVKEWVERTGAAAAP